MSAMYGRESESCLSGAGSSSFQATVFRGKNSAVISRLVFVADLRADPVKTLADVGTPVGPLVLAGPFMIHDRQAQLLHAPLERAVLIHETVFGSAIGEERGRRRLSFRGDEFLEAAARIARPPRGGVAAERR